MNTAVTSAAQWNREEIELIKSVIAPGLTDQELALFGRVAQRLDLDPFAGQIHAIKRWDSQTRAEKMTIQTSIHGLRAMADRTGAYAPGQPTTYEKDGDQLISATVYVRKLVAGHWHEVAETAYWAEYVQLNKSGEPAALWRSKPHVMLAKVAEALAIRRAFPAQTAGVYVQEEMDAADSDPRPVAPPPAPVQPRPASRPPAAPTAEAAFDRKPLINALQAAMLRGWEQAAIQGVMERRWQTRATVDLDAEQAAELIDILSNPPNSVGVPAGEPREDGQA